MHYKSGTEARVGDHVIGKPYNTEHQVAGTVVSLTPGAIACNLQVEFITSIKIATETALPRMRAPEAMQPRFSKSENHGCAGPEHARFICRDYGAVGDFELVGRPAHVVV